MINGESGQSIIVGATPNPGRYAFIAAEMLEDTNHPFIPLGIKRGEVLGQEILDIREQPEIQDVHTLTLYVGSRNLETYHDYLLSLQPKRIIFNPGAENPELYQRAQAAGIEVVNACTLVMIRSDQY